MKCARELIDPSAGSKRHLRYFKLIYPELPSRCSIQTNIVLITSTPNALFVIQRHAFPSKSFETIQQNNFYRNGTLSAGLLLRFTRLPKRVFFLAPFFQEKMKHSTALFRNRDLDVQGRSSESSFRFAEDLHAPLRLPHSVDLGSDQHKQHKQTSLSKHRTTTATHFIGISFPEKRFVDDSNSRQQNIYLRLVSNGTNPLAQAQ